MGGQIALTIRFDNNDCYRGSCWTNTLPVGFFDAEFYMPDKSRDHAKKWLDDLLAHRAANPAVEDMWGGWNKLAPTGYGLVLVDYVTDTLISGQGYTAPDQAYVTPYDSEPERARKFQTLEAAGLLGDRLPGPKGWDYRKVILPFKNVRIGDEGILDEKLRDWCKTNFKLSRAETTAWNTWIKRMRDDE